jgi:hypothetical protein
LPSQKELATLDIAFDLRRLKQPTHIARIIKSAISALPVHILNREFIEVFNSFPTKMGMSAVRRFTSRAFVISGGENPISKHIGMQVSGLQTGLLFDKSDIYDING